MIKDMYRKIVKSIQDCENKTNLVYHWVRFYVLRIMICMKTKLFVCT